MRPQKLHRTNTAAPGGTQSDGRSRRAATGSDTLGNLRACKQSGAAGRPRARKGATATAGPTDSTQGAEQQLGPRQVADVDRDRGESEHCVL